MSKNMHFIEPQNMRIRQYGEHYCILFKDGQYVGALYLNAQMRKVWRRNRFSVVMTDV